MSTGRNFLVLLFLAAWGLAGCSQDEDKVAPASESEAAATAEEAATDKVEPMVYFIAPAHEAKLKSPVRVKFGLIGMEVAPAGTDKPNSGHHHLLVDVAELPPAGQAIPADANHIHFGMGQTETELELAAGEHTLQLLLGDMNHVPHNPPVVSHRITITVIE